MQRNKSPRQEEKALSIQIGNLVLLCDHPESRNKIQDNYKNELFVVESQHQEPNVYTIKPLNGKGPMCKVNWQQLYDLQKTQGSDKPSDLAPNTILPTLLVKKPTRGLTAPQKYSPVSYQVQDPSKYYFTITL